MKTEHIKITPKMAQEWIATVPEMQRKVRAKDVAKIKLAILSNQWRENGATIVFNRENQLIDGQHRCHAIAEAGIAVRSLVVWGVASTEEVFNTIDDSTARKASDFVKCKNAITVASVMRFYWYVSNDRFPNMNVTVPTSDVLKVGKPFMSSIEDMTTIVDRAARLAKLTGFFTFLIWYHTDIHPLPGEKISSFVEGVATGIGLGEGDPILAYRNRIIENRTGDRGPNFKLTRVSQMALLVKALYAHVDGKRMKTVVWSPAKEEFPKLR